MRTVFRGPIKLSGSENTSGGNLKTHKAREIDDTPIGDDLSVDPWGIMASNAGPDFAQRSLRPGGVRVCGAGLA